MNNLVRAFDSAAVVTETTTQLVHELGETALGTLRDVVDAETAELVVRWLSSRKRGAVTTRRAYIDDVRRWAEWAAAWTGQRPVPLLRVITRDAVTLWTTWARSQGMSVRTQRRRLSTLSSLFTYAARHEVPVANPVDFEEHADRVGTGTNGRPVGATRALSLAEAHGMRRACTSLRDHIVFDLLYTNGLRVSELVSARVEHVSLAATPCTMQVRRKRGAWAVVPLAAATCDRLTTYLAGRAEGPLLLDAAGDALDRFDVVRITQRLARRGGLGEPDKVTPHVLRATAITSLLDSGAPLAEVQRWAGHARPETTQAYWERSNAVERDAALANRLAAMLDEAEAGLRR